ncbi:hypothetical protein FEM48_Zijuj09G0144000 [Ziziphus jujuba var. spinosa]|uniref:Branched-chain-amino-acid aminotransferase n=1 Tax=Ziziphus jujuba var. spinosa TaxID=714518 RepID=A0A978UTH7_ZIZJJ|nr:hypothetical protein FEM48_Zijuj09G0144000 [Ziziphus jujuba var. spinosa]
MNWDNLGFGLTPTDYMFVMKTSGDGCFTEGRLTRYKNIDISPSAGIFNYGQGLFEGAKAYRRADGHIQLFRIEENARRMKMGADRLCMPCPSIAQFTDAVKKTVLANRHWVPPAGKGSLYLRPLLFGSGPVLGIGPAPEYSFVIFASPIGASAMNLLVDRNVSRAAPGGCGGIKSITNYAPVFEVVKKAKAQGYADVLFLDATTGKNIEEVSSCNIFIVKNNVLSTPATQGTILPGITRRSIIEIATDFGYKVEEREVPLEHALDADEVFCSGTAVGITPVASITYQDKKVEYKTGEGTVSDKLRIALTGIQTGSAQDKKGWTVQLD